MYQSQAVIGITNARKNPPLEQCVWPADALNNIPDWVYTCLLYTSPSPRD